MYLLADTHFASFSSSHHCITNRTLDPALYVWYSPRERENIWEHVTRIYFRFCSGSQQKQDERADLGFRSLGHNGRFQQRNTIFISNNMMRKQSFKCSRSSMIFLQLPSNAVTKCLLLLSVTSFFTWTSLKHIGSPFIWASYLCNNHTQYA